MNRILRLTLAAIIGLSLLGLAVEIAGPEGSAWAIAGFVGGVVLPWAVDQVVAWYHRRELQEAAEAAIRQAVGRGSRARPNPDRPWPRA